MKRVLVGSAVVLILLASLALLVVDDAPAVPRPDAPDAGAPERVVALRRAFAGVISGGADSITLGREDFDALFTVAAWLHPDVRGRASPSPSGLSVEVSLGAPVPIARRWLNLRAVAAPSDEGVRLSRLSVGRLPLPATAAPGVAAAALDFFLGGDAFRSALDSVARVDMTGESATVAFHAGETLETVLGGRTIERVRRRAFHSDAETLERHFAAQGAKAAREGSAADWIAHALLIAADGADAGGEPRAEIEAALFALGLHCGTWRLHVVLGEPRRVRQASRCRGLTLGGRVDLRQHFAVSAALHAASAAQPAFSVGELKELYDSRGGSGFSFDDIAANRAGIRFAQQMLAGGPADWRRAAAMMDHEAALFPAVSDLPAGLSEAAFVERFGALDSAGYTAMLDVIERRVDALPVLSADE
ncbi:MAG: hypothetical protein EA355_05080 [Rhodobacteraceae bacterium]|nr:MAG: hypothetical protein EA355_05080 [Paracoccaceae bacterium]